MIHSEQVNVHQLVKIHKLQEHRKYYSNHEGKETMEQNCEYDYYHNVYVSFLRSSSVLHLSFTAV